MNNLHEFNQHVLDCYPQEACGLVIDKTFIPMPNISTEPIEHFMMEEGTYLTYEDHIDCILHSHTFIPTTGDARTPSLADMKLAKSTTLPQGIIHTDGEIVSDILYFNTKNPPRLDKRPYISGVFDCFTIVRDFYIQEFDYFIDILPRPANWEEWDSTYMLSNLDNQGLTKLANGASLKLGDVIVFRIGANVPNHVGVYLGNDTFIHHLNRRLSKTDTLAKWDRQRYANYRLIR